MYTTGKNANGGHDVDDQETKYYLDNGVINVNVYQQLPLNTYINTLLFEIICFLATFTYCMHSINERNQHAYTEHSIHMHMCYLCKVCFGRDRL